MHVVNPLSRKSLGRDGFALVVARDMSRPFEPGETIADEERSYTIVGIEAAEEPREVQRLVKLVPLAIEDR